jgi:hypothetical protein
VRNRRDPDRVRPAGQRACRLKSVGDWPLGYDRLGNRLCQIGPLPVEYDKWGSRQVAVGSMRIECDKLGNRPRRIVLPVQAHVGDRFLSTVTARFVF